jgi:hypothetical protein
MPTTARVNELSDGMCGASILINMLAVDGRSGSFATGSSQQEVGHVRYAPKAEVISEH